MKKEQTNNEAPMSLSKQRKIQRQKEIARAKRNKLIGRVVGVCVCAALGIGVASLVGFKIYREVTKVKPSSDYSAMIDDNGFISGVNAASSIDTCDYKGIVVPLSEIEYTDEEVQADIDTLLSNNESLSTDTDKLIEDGDKVNIDYVGTSEGVEFEGGNTNGEGKDLTIGSDSYIDGFEDQLIGYGVGDVVTVDVTFPETYTNNPDMAGKEASFEVTVNGIYIAPEFDDAFVAENLSDYASTADEYRQYLKDTNYNTSLEEWITNYLEENTTVTNTPKSFFNHMKSLQKYTDQSYYEYLNSYYSSMYGTTIYDSFESYVGSSESEYDKSLNDSVMSTLKVALALQAVLEQENITVTEEEYLAYLETQGQTEENYNSMVETYGKPYLMQQMVQVKALEIIKENVVVE